jgi:hypothetical protein
MVDERVMGDGQFEAGAPGEAKGAITDCLFLGGRRRDQGTSVVFCRVEVWRGGLGRCLCSLLARSFGCGCHIISTMLRFHTPLIEPDRRISRIRLSDKACVIAIFPRRRKRRLVQVGVGRVSGASQPVSGVSRPSPISRLSSPSTLGLELRPLPSTGVTRLQRYSEPLRHPKRPGLSLAGVRLRVPRPHRLGFPVLRWISMYRHAVVITPVAR